jgi:hypothetical protein
VVGFTFEFIRLHHPRGRNDQAVAEQAERYDQHDDGEQ